MIGMDDYSLINMAKFQQIVYRHYINAKLLNIIRIIILEKAKQKYIFLTCP